MLPRDEVDRLASQSAEFSTSGGVLGTRSGLPNCTPERNSSVGNRIIANFNTSTSNMSTAMRKDVDMINHRPTLYSDYFVMPQFLPLSASESVLLK